MANDVVPAGKPREQMGTQVPASRIARLVQAWQYFIDGVTPMVWMSPGQPLRPQHQETAGRQFDYPINVNLNWQPRRESSESGITFEQMRGLAESYDLLRLVIETRKDQIASFSWDVVPDDPDISPDDFKDDIKAVEKFLQYPNREQGWDEWLRMSLEEVLVTDAWCVYPRKTKGGGLYSLDLVDGSTIKRLVDESGRRPEPPSPAFQQVIKGVPTSSLTAEQLIYNTRNPRTWKIYGYPPVEQIIVTVNIALRRQLHQLNYYTEGNVPEAIAGVPDTWSADQIKQFQLWWDSLMEGNLAQRRHMKFIPKMDGIVFPKEPLLKDEMDDWLARLVCYCFSVAPTGLIKQMNRSQSEQVAKTAKEEGLFPWLTWLAARMTFIIQQHMGMPHLRFKWDMEESLDPKVQAEVDQIYITAQVITPDEVRDRMDLDEMTPEERNAAFPSPTEFGPDGQPIKKDKEGNVTSTHTVPPKPTKTTADEDREKAAGLQLTVNPVVKLGDTFVRINNPDVVANIDVHPAKAADVFVEAPEVNVAPAQVTIQQGDTHIKAEVHPSQVTVEKGAPPRVTTIIGTRDPETGNIAAKIEYHKETPNAS